MFFYVRELKTNVAFEEIKCVGATIVEQGN